MDGISDIRITGIDERRPPKMRREPYIDLVFRLAHKVPVEWCHDFIRSQAGAEYQSTINLDECLYIETWVRTPAEIAAHLQTLKKLVAECNARYVARIEASRRDEAHGLDHLRNEEGPQGALNRIIAELDFGD